MFAIWNEVPRSARDRQASRLIELASRSQAAKRLVEMLSEPAPPHQATSEELKVLITESARLAALVMDPSADMASRENAMQQLMGMANNALATNAALRVFAEKLADSEEGEV